MPNSEYARSARCNVYDDVDLADDEIAQKLKEMRPQKKFTVDSDDEPEEEEHDKVGLHVSGPTHSGRVLSFRVFDAMRALRRVQ